MEGDIGHKHTHRLHPVGTVEVNDFSSFFFKFEEGSERTLPRVFLLRVNRCMNTEVLLSHDTLHFEMNRLTHNQDTSPLRLRAEGYEHACFSKFSSPPTGVHMKI